jgi:protein-tyrosine phosphatase
VSVGDFERFDHILAMDGQNLADLRAIQPGGAPARLSLFLDYHPDPPFSDVPDPYYGGDAGFDEVLDLVEAAGRGLLAALSR